MRTQTQDGGGISKMCPNGKKKKNTDAKYSQSKRETATHQWRKYIHTKR